MIRPAASEYARQADFLNSAIDFPLSGHTRYGAAMYFYNHGTISADALEIYRICAPLDCEDPIKILQAHGLAGEVLAAIALRPREEKTDEPR